MNYFNEILVRVDPISVMANTIHTSIVLMWSLDDWSKHTDYGRRCVILMGVLVIVTWTTMFWFE